MLNSQREHFFSAYRMTNDHIDLLIQSLEEVAGQPEDGDEPLPPPQQQQLRGHKHYNQAERVNHEGGQADLPGRQGRRQRRSRRQ